MLKWREYETACICLQLLMEKENSIEFLDVHPKIINGLRHARVKSIRRIMEMTESDLSRCAKLSQRETVELKVAASRAILHGKPSLSTAADLLLAERKKGRLSISCPVLNSWLKGGLLVPGVTEIAGTSAAGKTQICMQLSLSVQLPAEQGGLDGACAYICTEDVFPHRRLMQLAEAFAAEHKSLGHSAKSYTDKVMLAHCATVGHLESLLTNQVPPLMTLRNVRLVIIDSVAAVFRADFNQKQLFARAQHLCSIGSRLRDLAAKCGAAVVVVNQVTADFNAGQGSEAVKPCLGETWASQVNMRLLVDRTNLTQIGNSHHSLRTMSVPLAPHLPESTIHYFIDECGVHGVNTSESVESFPTANVLE